MILSYFLLHPQSVTQKLLWHHQLFRPCDQYLYNYHKYIDGVPNFGDTNSRVLDQCPTFIQAKIYKTPPGHGNTRVSTQSYQGISIDLYFYGTTYDDSYKKTIY